MPRFSIVFMFFEQMTSSTIMSADSSVLKIVSRNGETFAPASFAHMPVVPRIMPVRIR